MQGQPSTVKGDSHQRQRTLPSPTEGGSLSSGTATRSSQPLLDFVVQSLSCVQLLVTQWAAACQASLSITISRRLLKLRSIELVMPSNHLILCRPLLSCFQSFPASGSFPMSQFFASGGQSIGVSASTSVLPMNTRTDLL